MATCYARGLTELRCVVMGDPIHGQCTGVNKGGRVFGHDVDPQFLCDKRRRKPEWSMDRHWTRGLLKWQSGIGAHVERPSWALHEFDVVASNLNSTFFKRRFYQLGYRPRSHKENSWTFDYTAGTLSSLEMQVSLAATSNHGRQAGENAGGQRFGHHSFRS